MTPREQSVARRGSIGPGGALAELRFRYPFRRYQQMVLDVVDGEAGKDHKYHIVAPPGSGKTIVGLELIRRFGQPAVVFCPTTTIQQQWQEKVGLFTEDEAWIESHTSLDPRRLAEITVLTYQVLSTPGENLAFVERIAVERWVEDLLRSGRAHTDEEARERVETLRAGNPRAYRAEISKRYRRIKRKFLQESLPPFSSPQSGEGMTPSGSPYEGEGLTPGGRQFLHANARDLIERIVAMGTGTVVLDECHHLLDYWAFILRELIRALPGVRVVGLTATLPDPANQAEYENYVSLLGQVDLDVPTPAVVKEGNLAPYRDLVYFCEPSPREQDYLREIQRHFQAAVWRVSNTAAFREWLWKVLGVPPSRSPVPGQHWTGPQRGERRSALPSPQRESVLCQTGTGEQPVPAVSPGEGGEAFAAAFRKEPLLCIAAAKYLLEVGVFLPLEWPLIDEMLEPLGIEDWLILMENYGLQALKVSGEAEHRALYRDLKDALLPFGITIGEQGIRHQRSPGDLVLALSEAKDQGVVEILRAERDAMGGKLRALVLTDYERLSARTRRLTGVLDPDAGSAVRIFRLLVADGATRYLAPVLVTGNVVLAGAVGLPLLEKGMQAWVEQHKANVTWQWRETDSEQVRRLEGSGPDWSSRTYVALMTEMLEQGVVQCLVGTRGIFGEGWDAVRLNTLVDLTSVTTSTGVRQIRGRAIRLDAAWGRKVAHNWDVVCVSRDFERGDMDLRRFMARHVYTWGVVARKESREAGSRKQEAGKRGSGEAGNGEGQEKVGMRGRVVRGVAHVDVQLAADLAAGDFRKVHYYAYTRRMLKEVWERDRSYELWGVGQPYENQVYSATRIEAREVQFRTVSTVQGSLGAMTRRLLASLAAVGGAVWVNGALVLPWAGVQALPGLGLGVTAVTGGAALAAVGLNARGIWRVFHRSFLELPADAVLLDMGRALLAALRQAGVVGSLPHSLPGGGKQGEVRVVETEGGNYEVSVEGAAAEDSAVFARAFGQMMGPLGDARYLIERDSTSLRNLVYRPLWLLVRTSMGLDEAPKAYHRVPDVLATRRERAEALAHYWEKYVGGGRLLYTRTDEGRRLLLEARGRQRGMAGQVAFDVWR